MKKTLSLLIAAVMVFFCTAVFTVTTALPAAAEDLPAAADLTGSIHMPPIGNQGSVGCCISMAASYMQFTNAYSRYIHSIDPNVNWNPSSGSAEYIFSPRFTFNLGGMGTTWIYDILKEQGTVPQTYSTFTNGVTGAAVDSDPLTYDWATIDGYWEVAQNYRLKNYDAVWLGTEPYGGQDVFNITGSSAGQELIRRIKSHLNAGNVVTTGGNVYAWVTHLTTISNRGTYGKSGDKAIPYATDPGDNGGHQVSIVGYDDNITCVVNGVTLRGAFKIANSWGTGWVNDGYVWLMYDALNGTGKSAYSALNVSDRVITMDGMVFVDWHTDLNIGTPAVMASVKLTTADRNSFAVTLVKTDLETGKTETHMPFMFEYAWVRPNYDRAYGFYGRTDGNATTGEITVNFDYFTDNLPEGKTIDDYIWGVMVTYVDTDSGRTSTVKRVKLLKNGNVTYTLDNLNDTVTKTNAKSYTLDSRRIISLHAAPGVTLVPASGSFAAEAGSRYDFTLNVGANCKIQNVMNVYFNGAKITPVNGVYSVTVANSEAVDGNIVKVEGVLPKSVKIIDFGNYGDGFEDQDGPYWMVLTLLNDSVDASAVDKNAIAAGTYLYDFRCTINGVSYDFKPQSFYDFDTTTLFRINVADQGWFPTAGTTYTMRVELCIGGIPIYVDNSFTITCRLAPHSDVVSAHTHSFTGEVLTIATSTCSAAGSGYTCCTTPGCKARTQTALPLDSSVHRFSSTLTVTKNATATEPGELSCTCADCGATAVAEYFTAQPGDADGDNQITVNDATMMLNVLKNAAPVSSLACGGDLTGDELCTIKDLTMLLLILGRQ